jgi:pyruvate dehydrogenase phosphatase
MVIFACGAGAAFGLDRYMATSDSRKYLAEKGIPATVHTHSQVPDLSRKSGPSANLAIEYAAAPSSEDVTKALNEHTFSHGIGGSSGVVQYDGAQLPSNSRCEDSYLHGMFPNPTPQPGTGTEWYAWGVFDGHCGWQLSSLLSTQLLPYVQRQILEAATQEGGATQTVSDATVHKAMVRAFEAFDEALIKNAAAILHNDNLSFAEKLKVLEPASAGSCALLTLFDPTTRSLHIASTGDCRAVMGRRTAEGKWEAIQLTVDQTGANADEIARIQARFPTEPDIINGGRVWGMQPSRTFGDGGWKWDKDLRRKLREEYNACQLPSEARYKHYKTGPYLTASPTVSSTKIDRDNDSFLIVATDGLWDTMSSEQAVDLVGRWKDAQRGKGEMSPTKVAPVDLERPALGKRYCRYEEKYATFQDGNSAVHLIRNGLGGAHDELVRGALAIQAPMSRDIRDDFTVQVVFFGGEEGSK